MQRSAAKSATSSPSTPSGPPPSKKVRLSNGASAPGTPGTPLDHEVIQSALAAEERKREEALSRAAEKSGETKWVLSFKEPQDGARTRGMQVRQAGFAVIDADDEASEEGEEEEEEGDKVGKRVFGGGVPKKVALAVKEEGSESESSSDDDSDDDFDSDDPTAELIRETKREKKREARMAHTKTERETPQRFKVEPLDEDMYLGGLQSLSGERRPPSSNLANIECHRCKQKGHFIKDCPQQQRGTPRGSAGRGRPRGGRGWGRGR